MSWKAGMTPRLDCRCRVASRSSRAAKQQHRGFQLLQSRACSSACKAGITPRLDHRCISKYGSRYEARLTHSESCTMATAARPAATTTRHHVFKGGNRPPSPVAPSSADSRHATRVTKASSASITRRQPANEDDMRKGGSYAACSAAVRACMIARSGSTWTQRHKEH